MKERWESQMRDEKGKLEAIAAAHREVKRQSEMWQEENKFLRQRLDLLESRLALIESRLGGRE